MDEIEVSLIQSTSRKGRKRKGTIKITSGWMTGLVFTALGFALCMIFQFFQG